MGTLIVMRDPTSLVANLADHTYVKCGTGGKAWGCWGGKTGGTELRRGTGSTKQADAIAEADERAPSLGSKLDKPLEAKLKDIRMSAEWSRMKIEDLFSNDEMKPSEFVEALNKETILFQEATANTLKPGQYKLLFGLKPGDTVILADPSIVKAVYGDK